MNNVRPLKFIANQAALQGQFEQEISQGLYSGIHIRLSGTNNASQAVAHSDIEFVFVRVNGKEIVRVPGTFLKELDNQLYGFVQATSTPGGAFDLAFHIPLELPGFPNSLFVDSGDTVTVGITEGSGFATAVSAGTYEIYGELGESGQNYLAKMLTDNITQSAAGTVREKIPNVNIQSIWINESSANVLNRINIERDGKLVLAAPYDVLINYSSMFTRIESTGATWVYASLGNAVSDLLSDDVQMEITFDAAGTANIVYLSFEFEPEKRRRSNAFKNQDVQNRIDKVQPKRPSDISAVKSLFPLGGNFSNRVDTIGL